MAAIDFAAFQQAVEKAGYSVLQEEISLGIEGMRSISEIERLAWHPASSRPSFANRPVRRIFGGSITLSIYFVEFY